MKKKSVTDNDDHKACNKKSKSETMTYSIKAYDYDTNPFAGLLCLVCKFPVPTRNDSLPVGLKLHIKKFHQLQQKQEDAFKNVSSNALDDVALDNVISQVIMDHKKKLLLLQEK